MSIIEEYDYTWDTPEKIIENLNTVRDFGGWGITSLAEHAEVTDPEVYRAAHALWLKLKEVFNAEAAYYVDGNTDYDGHPYLGSVGPTEEREVMRECWFESLNGDEYGDYRQLTRIIEMLHDGEELETGTILFGS